MKGLAPAGTWWLREVVRIAFGRGQADAVEVANPKEILNDGI
jgi:hypothetical protein